MEYESGPLPCYKYLRNLSYTINFQKLPSPPIHSTSHPTYCSRHRINFIFTRIIFAPVHSSYMVRKDTCAATFYCLLCIYSMIGHIPVVSSASATRGHYHSPSVVRCAVIPIILIAALWWNPSSIFIMTPSPPNSRSHKTTPTDPINVCGLSLTSH